MDDNCQIFSFGRFELNPNDSNNAPDWNCLPVLPTRNLVLFPGVTIPISLMRSSSLELAKTASEKHIPVGIVCQLNRQDDSISDTAQLCQYGVVGDILQVIDLPGNEHTALVRARGKFRITGKSDQTVIDKAFHICAKPVTDRVPSAKDNEFNVLIDSIKQLCTAIAKNADGAEGLLMTIEHTTDPTDLVNTTATHLPLNPADKMKMLSKHLIKQRAFELFRSMSKLMNNMAIANDIKERAKEEMNQQGRQAFLQQQLNTIREELYGPEGEEIDNLRKKVKELELPEAAAKTVEKEIDKLSRINPAIPDYSTLLSYLETVLDLPWNTTTEINNDFQEAENILNNDHYGLEKVKDRILEQMAVIINNPKGRAPIICLVGAPGVGKTSLGQSIAKALGRTYQRVSLGGLHDEAEIRGHRRTYIGAMPGRIIDSIRRAKSKNPVILLDEVDKIGADFKGDPSAALLEVLDPEQNCHFHDNYIDVDFDLSDVLFIATANTLSTLSQPLLDRMEIIEISGYLLEEKMEIARRHLLPRVLANHNITQTDMNISDDALRYIIEHYTAESGVRQLEKSLSSLARKTVLRKMRRQDNPSVIEPEHLYDYLGLPQRHPDRYEGNDFAGVVTGLAWTSAGGEILFIESSLAKGSGEKLTLTGNLGDVMKESAAIALQYVKANAETLGIPSEMFTTHNLHIHVPEGAIPKDGPSAGITMATSIVSAFTHRKVRSKLAMTGEITLRGKVLPVGGIKEKILAAKRAGIKEIILSSENRRDVDDINSRFIEGLTFHYADTVLDVLRIAITDEKA